MEKNCDEQSEKNSDQQSEKNSDEQSEKNCDKESEKDDVEELEKNCEEEFSSALSPLALHPPAQHDQRASNTPPSHLHRYSTITKHSHRRHSHHRAATITGFTTVGRSHRPTIAERP
nr:putative membrane protein [Ipomoea batatas]GME08946.1 putative membrane protein [Ipomoea batatas]